MDSEATVRRPADGKVRLFRLRPKPGDLPLDVLPKTFEGEGWPMNRKNWNPNRIERLGFFVGFIEPSKKKGDAEKRIMHFFQGCITLGGMMQVETTKIGIENPQGIQF
jgi:hypothetical protein